MHPERENPGYAYEKGLPPYVGMGASQWLIRPCIKYRMHACRQSIIQCVSDVYSGGTEVTVFGSHLNSVAEPRITLTVVITTPTSSENKTDSEVI